MIKYLTGVFPLTQNDDKTYILLGEQPKGRPLSGFLNGYGGKVEDGEDILVAAQRELLEEIGITSQQLIKLGVVTHTDKEIHFYAVVVEKLNFVDSDEMIDNKWYDLVSDNFVDKMLPGDGEIISFIQNNIESIFKSVMINEFRIAKAGLEITCISDKI